MGEGLRWVRYPTGRAGQSRVRGWQSAIHPYHGDCVIEQGLAKDDDKESLVDVHLLKDSQHSHGVHCRDEASKQQEVQQASLDPGG